MPIFGHSKFLPVFLYQKGFNKFRMCIFGHSEFMPVFLGKMVRKNSEQTFLAIPNLYQSFWEKLSEKIWNGHFWSFRIYTSLFGKNCQKKFGMAFLAIPNLYQSFQIFSDNFSVHITLIECNGLENNEICTFLDFYSEI